MTWLTDSSQRYEVSLLLLTLNGFFNLLQISFVVMLLYQLRVWGLASLVLLLLVQLFGNFALKKLKRESLSEEESNEKESHEERALRERAEVKSHIDRLDMRGINSLLSKLKMES